MAPRLSHMIAATLAVTCFYVIGWLEVAMVVAWLTLTFAVLGLTDLFGFSGEQPGSDPPEGGTSALGGRRDSR